MGNPLSADELTRLDAYWRAANYLSVGQIYLFDNPLLREPLARSRSSRGCWVTGAPRPGLNFVYAHLNRAIRERDLDLIFVCGPGHGGPGMVANAYLEGTYSELYSDVSQDEEGLRRLFKQFSFPRGIPSHAAPETPGSINEGGELGYSLLHAYGAAFDNPDLLVACVVGDGEAETGPLATSWHSNKFLDPATTGRCCQSSISTATRSPTRPSWHGSRATSSSPCSRATVTSRSSSKATIRWRCTS